LAQSTFKNYHDSLLAGDFLFCDGIACQVAYFLLKIFRKIPQEDQNKFWVNNLNGTDFLPYFFNELKTKYGTHKINVILYGSYPEYVKKTQDYFLRKGIHVVYTQDGYSELDWKSVEEGINEYKDKINILLVARSHPVIPVQELWVAQNLEQIKKNNLITFTVGGLFDHLIGVQSR
jgi:UDP-N-acetyl-D-mannosaminuronic acid transferase (WecB/TagA/CpsF family)